MRPTRIDQILMTLDKAVSWTGISERIRVEALYQGNRPRPRPLRWVPLFPIVSSVALFVASLVRPSVLEISMGAVVAGLLPLIQRLGPLGNPSIDDDEREASLRRNSWLFCFGLLAILNCLGQPVLALAAQLRGWPVGHTAIVIGTAFMLNVCLFGNLPTLYASWSLGQLSAE